MPPTVRHLLARRLLGLAAASLLATGCRHAPSARTEESGSWYSERRIVPGPFAVLNGESPAWIALHPAPGEPAIYESTPDFGAFTEALVSWNVRVPRGLRVRFEVRASPTNTQDDWTPWMFVGEVGEPPFAGEIVTQSDLARVDVDYLRCERPCKRLQWRAIAECQGASGESVVIRRFTTTLTRANDAMTPGHATPPNAVGDSSDRAPATAHRRPPRAWGVNLPVPFLSQKTDKPELAGRLCSPTSVAMVLRHYGRNVTVQQVAERAHDPRHDLYGNWPRNVQAAFDFGVMGEVTRLSTWSQAERLIERGIPIIISFKAAKGQLRNAPYDETDGHLIVLTGFNGIGDVHVNDPACATPEEGRRVYFREDLTRVWLEGNKGTCYVLYPPRD